MNPRRALALAALLLAGCASPSHPPSATVAPPPRAGGPNWGAVDGTVQRVRERERTKLQAVETERTVESGFFAMTDDEYAAALESARSEVRKANPKMSESDIEAEAVKKADEAKRRHEQSFTRRASSTYQIKSP